MKLSPFPLLAFQQWPPNTDSIFSQTSTYLVYVLLLDYHHLRESIFSSYVFLKFALEEIMNDATYSSGVQSLWKYQPSTCLCSSYKLVMSLECFPMVIKPHSFKVTAFCDLSPIPEDVTYFLWTSLQKPVQITSRFQEPQSQNASCSH